jgi:hypothetical protein
LRPYSYDIAIHFETARKLCLHNHIETCTQRAHLQRYSLRAAGVTTKAPCSFLLANAPRLEIQRKASPNVSNDLDDDHIPTDILPLFHIKRTGSYFMNTMLAKTRLAHYA